MRFLNSRNSWVYSHGFNMMVDFCIWVLEVDGLHVPPFDQHPDGKGPLQAAGLDAAGWQSWLIRVVNLQYRQQQVYEQRFWEDPLNRQVDLRSMLISEALDPPTAWMGNATVGSQLSELWRKQYGLISNDRRDWEIRLTRTWHKGESERPKRLYDELQPYHTRIPTMIIHLVEYAQPINYLIPPVSVIMTVANGQPDAAEFRERVLDAAAGLSAKGSAQHRSQSKYTFVPSIIPNQPIPSYKTYTRKPAQPEVPRSKAQIVAENEVKQIIFDSLNDERGLYGDVNMDTVQFLREKTIAGWQLHYVSFEEGDGSKNSLVIILRQSEDGSWILNSSSTAGNFREAVAQFLAPVHDHPLISVSGGTNSERAGNDMLQYKFVAYGDVIDNGFDVAHVRLTNDAGQAFEDVVEDGLVFFGSIQEREVQRPMQAELYNRAGKLVWRETVLDNRLPVWLKFKRR